MEKIFAQVVTLPGNTAIRGIDAAPETIGVLIGRMVPYLFAFAGFGLLLVIIRAGFTLLTSSGDAKKIEQGKQQLTMGVAGFFIIFASFWIVQAVGTILGYGPAKQIFIPKAPSVTVPRLGGPR